MLPHPSRLVPVLALTLSVWGCSAPLQRPFQPRIDRPLVMDVRDYAIEIELDPRARHVTGEVAITLAALPDHDLERVRLDAVELDIHRVWDDHDRELAFALSPETLAIELAEPLPAGQQTVLHITWDAYPRRGLYFEGPSRADPTRPWHVWSQGETHEARHWLPCWDQPTDRATHSLGVTVDDDFITLCAGRLVDSEELPASGRRVDHWRMDTPHTSYLITLVAGQLGQGELRGAQPMPVVARPRDLDQALFATRRTADMIAFYGQLTGQPYPYSKYAQTLVDDFTAGGMENISATTLYDEALHRPEDEPQVDVSGLVAHELAHQWFGDLLTCDGWAHLWLNEGFADWCELRWQGQHLGRAEMQRMFLDSQFAGCQAELNHSRPVVWFDFPDPDDLFDAHSYQAAAARIRLLAHTLGEQPFLQGLAGYVQRHKAGLVTTDDFQQAMEDASGRDLSRFFDEWFHGVGYPVVEGRVQPDGHTLRLTQVQQQRGWRELFHVGFTVSWSRAGVEHRAEVSFEQPELSLDLQGEGALDWVRLDADTVLPGERWMHQDEAAWASQLARASDPVTRLVAARWFAGNRWIRPADQAVTEPSARTIQVLQQTPHDEPSWAVRVELARALGGLETEHAIMPLLALSEDADARVRAAAIEALGLHFEGDVPAVVAAAVDDENDSVVAAAMRVLVEDGGPGVFSSLRRLLARANADPARVRLARDLVSLLPRLDHPAVLPLLIETARTHPERWVRAAAVRALGELSDSRIAAEGDAPHPHDHLSHTAADAIFEVLAGALRDEADGVRRAAVSAMASDGVESREERQLRALWDLETAPGVLSGIEQALH